MVYTYLYNDTLLWKILRWLYIMIVGDSSTRVYFSIYFFRPFSSVRQPNNRTTAIYKHQKTGFLIHIKASIKIIII